MVVIGVWHGAGWNLVIFGAMHGTYVAINEAWAFRRRQRKMKPLPLWLTAPVDAGGKHVLVLLAFVLASIPFRAADVSATGHMFAGLVGLGAEPTDAALLWPLGAFGVLGTLLVGYLLVYVTPNTQQMMRNHAPALDFEDWRTVCQPALSWVWRPTPLWVLAGGAVLCLGMAFILRGTTEFIYFNF